MVDQGRVAEQAQVELEDLGRLRPQLLRRPVPVLLQVGDRLGDEFPIIGEMAALIREAMIRPQDWNNCFKFAVVREPVARIVSHWRRDSRLRSGRQSPAARQHEISFSRLHPDGWCGRTSTVWEEHGLGSGLR